MSGLVGDKLLESAQTTAKTKGIIEILEAEVEFPDIRSLVNAGDLSFAAVLRIRGKARG